MKAVKSKIPYTEALAKDRDKLQAQLNKALVDLARASERREREHKQNYDKWFAYQDKTVGELHALRMALKAVRNRLSDIQSAAERLEAKNYPSRVQAYLAEIEALAKQGLAEIDKT